MHVPTTVPVLIVGGGPVGLTLSNLLSRYGVDHLLVEARPGTSRHPKARGVSARSMEIFRRCGLEDAVRGAALPASQVFFSGAGTWSTRTSSAAAWPTTRRTVAEALRRPG
ncbi:FAD-dependent monooxygenase [Streptomyces sp. NPDC088184]|uniref:FAD-dependent monooxygenase n=1 Tax=Streptomyces sp. NPDC088184 TaxID=3160991 RepID=UPI0034307B76